MAKLRSGFYCPKELMLQIFSLLPIISLLRCRSVCKSWRSMISDPQLIENHLIISQKKQAHVLRFSPFQVISGWMGNFCSTFYVDTRDFSVTFKLPPNFTGMNWFVRSCNGLVCLSDKRGDNIYLWNPLIERFKILPTPKKQIHGFNFRLDLGFCFDSISKDYKLFRILVSIIPYDGVGTSVLEAELYSTNTNSWKEIQVPKTAQRFLPSPYSECVNTKTGVLYLEGFNELLSFHSHNEVFGVHRFPNSVDQKRKSNVLDYDGSVAMIFGSIGDESVLSLCTLEDVCGKLSWVKKFNVEVDQGIDWIALHLGAGQFVARNYNPEYLYYYDYKKKETKNFPLLPPTTRFMSLVKYTESLVSLEGFEQVH